MIFFHVPLISQSYFIYLGYLVEVFYLDSPNICNVSAVKYCRRIWIDQRSSRPLGINVNLTDRSNFSQCSHCHPFKLISSVFNLIKCVHLWSIIQKRIVRNGQKLYSTLVYFGICWYFLVFFGIFLVYFGLL